MTDRGFKYRRTFRVAGFPERRKRKIDGLPFEVLEVVQPEHESHYLYPLAFIVKCDEAEFEAWPEEVLEDGS